MNLLHRIHALLDPIALRLLKWLNGGAGLLMMGIAGFSALHPNFPAEVQAALHLTPMQGVMVGIVWCAVVAYVVKRATKAAS